MPCFLCQPTFPSAASMPFRSRCFRTSATMNSAVPASCPTPLRCARTEALRALRERDPLAKAAAARALYAGVLQRQRSLLAVDL